MFMSKMSPFQFRKLPFMQNLLTLCFPILKNGLFKHVASAGAIKENQSTGISVSWVVFFAFSLASRLMSWESCCVISPREVSCSGSHPAA